jgi:outer membrane receptor for ferrienterochelin and colicins
VLCGNLIAFVFDQQTNGSFAQNVGEQIGKGGELAVRWKPRQDMTVHFNYSHLKATDGNTDAVAGLPNTMFYTGMNWFVDEHWQWSIDSKWVKDRYRAFSDDRQQIKDYQWVTSRLARREIIPGLSVSLVVKNLFDVDAREPSSGAIADDFPLHGRLWSLELNYAFE